ncbi:MAG: hypothetical protein ACXWWG_00540 [Nitrospira sp.]
MDKFSYIDEAALRWDFEILTDGNVKVTLPTLKVEHVIKTDFDPRVDFEGDQSMWIDWACTELLEAGALEFDEWIGLQSPDGMEEAKQEARWERDHVCSERSQHVFH